MAASPSSSLEEISEDIGRVHILEAAIKGAEAASSQTGTDSNGASLDADKEKPQFLQYVQACEQVKGFYCEQHEKQTVAYNIKARRDFHSKTRAEMTIWEALQKLDTIADRFNPDTNLSQSQHLIQTAEALRRDGKPRWMQLTGLIHGLGKLLYFFGAEGQWDIVGDTFPVGCAFSNRIIYHDSFAANPDSHHPIYSTKHGIYMPGCGIDNIMLSWGQDEYLYRVVRDQSTLPGEALAMIRYRSFYAWHSDGAYEWMMEEKDVRTREAVKTFSPYDLYSKSDEAPDIEDLKAYYLDLIDEFFPTKVINW